MIKKNVFTYVENSGKEKWLRSCIIVTPKSDEKGNLIKVKARLVADGSTQQLKAYQESASPTAKVSSVHAVVKIATFEERKIFVEDV